MSELTDTIAAVVTPPGRGGVGIVRVSGPQVAQVAQQVLGFIPKPRIATLASFRQGTEVLDEGLALYFVAPHSFTGEDVLELQGHGGPVVQQMLLNSLLSEQVRLAQPGEFSQRAFLNHKMDLAQAEAVADLINAESEQAAKSAVRSLQGEFSRQIEQLVAQVIQLRVFVEAALDFPDEEIDFLSEASVRAQQADLQQQLGQVLQTARQGALLREGMTVVIAGEPNAGKSSLLNALCGRDTAIVTDIAGTTRDVLREHIHIDGMPLHILDTAGLRTSADVVEQEGVRRARVAIADADLLLVVIDGAKHADWRQALEQVTAQLTDIDPLPPIAVVINKIDLLATQPQQRDEQGITLLSLSAKAGQGLELLRSYLKGVMGFATPPEGVFIARQRHLEALLRAEQALQRHTTPLALELFAEDLREVQTALSTITGAFTTDDLLGEIFSSFCIGK